MRDELNTNVESDEYYANEHLEKLDELQKHGSICHLSTESMSSTFDEFHPDTFTLCKHKITDSFRHQKYERVDLFSCA